MRPDPRVLLADVERAASDITRFTEGMDHETYVGDARTQAAVERKFEIIGEALNRLHQTHPEVAARIPSLREIVGFRNLLIHGYAIVIPERVWDYAENDLPDLHKVVQTLLAEMGPPEEYGGEPPGTSTVDAADQREAGDPLGEEEI